MVGGTRVCARVVLLDASSRVLLLETSRPEDGGRYWFTPGGGLEAGETLEQAAAREVREETGWSDLRFVGPMCSQELDFTDREPALHQVDHFFAARTDRTELRADGWTELEQHSVTAWRWWTIHELRGRGVTYFPEDLVELVGRAEIALAELR